MSIFTNPAARSAEEAMAYTAAVLDLLGTRDPIEVLTSTPGDLRQAIDGLTEQEMARSESPGKWAINQVCQHLADSELVWAYRLRMILSQDRPVLTGYDQDLWAERLGYASAQVEQALLEFSVLRTAQLRLLGGLGPADLDRVGRHAERGEETVQHMIRLYAGHDLLHLRQLERIRQAVVGASGAQA